MTTVQALRPLVPHLAPEVTIEQRFTDLLDGRDPILDWVLSRPSTAR